MPAKFIHLRAHTEYSLSDGILRVKPFVNAVKELGMPAVAMTDRCNFFAVVQFYRAAMAAGVKPIIASDLYLENKKSPDKPYCIVALCQNNTGYNNLTCLITRAYQEGQETGRPIVTYEWLKEASEGLIILSGAMSGDVGQALLSENEQDVESSVEYWKTHFPDRYYLELHRVGRPNEALYTQKAVDLAVKHDLPVVATNDIEFLEKTDFEAHEARVCIYQNWQLSNAKRPKLYTENQYLRSSDEMEDLFSDMPQAIQNTVEIAKRCNVELKLFETFLPNFPVPEGMTIDEFFIEEAEKGLEKRLEVLFEKDDIAAARGPYDDRLATELKVINRMGFPGYFLIVADFIRWSRANDVPVGPGRGSGAGSLVAYALEITNLDPIHYKLLFERFLNPERVSMPDFDIDFCMDGRDRVIEYVANKYGRESVSQIITFGTMAAKAVVRDVGRALGLSYGFVDKIAKLIPFEIGMTLTKAMEQEEALRSRYNNEEEVTTLIDLAMQLEGITRNAGKHAGGVVIAPTKLTDFTPLYCEPGSTQAVTQFHKDDVETMGLVKFDFLGLRTLTIIDWAQKTINARRKQQSEEPIDIDVIPVDDQATYELLKSCETTAVFQLESRGMKDLIHRLQPDCFDEIVALVALFRPGPLQSGMVDDFIDRKHGRAEVVFPHEELGPILESTYGVILYQEQVMSIAQVMAGYSLGAADILRRAMGKKKPEEMAQQREIFTKGAVARGIEESTATYVFDLMEKFAGYGFNKSHSAAYALLAYQTAWLKTHYPEAFMAAVLSSDMDNTDKVVIFVEDCKHLKLSLLAPNINSGFFKFTVNDKDEIIYGLGSIKGVGEAAIELIVEERETNGAYTDLFDFCARLDLRKVNKRVLEAIIKSGAMDVFDVHRASLFASIVPATHAADQQSKNAQSGQDDMFAMFDDSPKMDVDYVDTKPWREDVRLRSEKEALGYYLSGHPILRYAEELKQFTKGPIVNLRPTHNQKVRIAGLVMAVRTMQTKRGDRMAFISLDDSTARIEIAVFADAYITYKDLLVKDSLLVVEGDISLDEYTGGYKMSCQSLQDIATARELHVKQLALNFSLAQMEEGALENLATVLKPYRGGLCPVKVAYERPDARSDFMLGQDWRVKPTDELLEKLEDIFSKDVFSLEYS